jgi:hypothetical protein
MLKEGNIPNPKYEIESEGNIGSLFYKDKTDESNLYMFLLTMRTIGFLENRYAAPNDDGARTQPLPWTSAAEMDVNGCSLAGSILMMIDSVVAIQSQLSTVSLGDSLTAIKDMASVMDAGCIAGCTICGLTCTGCPYRLRYRGTCLAGDATDKAACAAAGIVKAVNATWTSGS